VLVSAVGLCQVSLSLSVCYCCCDDVADFEIDLPERVFGFGSAHLTK